MMANILSSHSKYVQRTTSNEINNESCIHKRILDNANQTFKENKKLKKFEIKKLQIEEQEKAIRKKQAQAKLLIEQANSLMEDTQNMSKFLSKEKVQLENADSDSS